MWVSQGQLRSLSLCGFALTHYLLFFVANRLLAQQLSIQGFDDYSVAISLTTLLATFATLGLEKYSLKQIPTWLVQQDWPCLRGFWRFSISSTLLTSLFLAIFTAMALETVFYLMEATYHVGIVVAISFLPLVAMFLLFVEVLTAGGRPVLATALYRLVVPLLFLGFLFVWPTSLWPLTAVAATFCYGVAWAVVALVAYVLIKRHTMPAVHTALPRYTLREWMPGALPYLGNSLMLTLMAQSGILILELEHPSESVVGLYAIAFQLAMFMVLLATSTNRSYLPQLAALMAQGDRSGMQRLSRLRMQLVGTLTLLFALTLFFFGQQILHLFGPHFQGGYLPLCILTVGASIGTLFSAAPYYLQFIGQSKRVFSLTLAALLLNLTLTLLLSQRYGATGAALSYTIAVSLLWITLKVLAIRHFRRYWSAT